MNFLNIIEFYHRKNRKKQVLNALFSGYCYLTSIKIIKIYKHCKIANFFFTGFHACMNISATKTRPTCNFRAQTKPQWKNFAQNDSRQIFEDCSVNHGVFGQLNVTLRKCEDGFNRWVIEIKNALDKHLGKEIISMENNKAMTGYDIIVHPEYRKKGYKLGELLRLFSVMEMHKNNSPFLKIYSKDTAVYFHSKYKFVPCNRTFTDRNRMLESMANDSCADFSDIALSAKNLQKLAKETQNNPEKQRALCIDTNKLASEYINRAIEKEKEPQIKHSFFYGMDMVLTRENLEKNKEFYNRLFEKHGIDYKI